MAKREWTAEERAEASRKTKARIAEAQAVKAAASEEKPLVMPLLPFDADDFASVEIEAIEELVAAAGELSPFEVYLSSLDDETKELVPEAELQAIFEAQTIKARAAKREKLKKAATEKAMHAANVHAGLLPKDAVDHAEWRRRMDRLVTFTVDLPELGDIGLRVDGEIFLHGFQYTRPMAVYLSFREMEWKNKQAELDFEGRSRMHHLRRQGIGANNMRLN